MYKTCAILADKKSARAGDILKKRLADRNIEAGDGGAEITLTVSDGCPRDGFRVIGGEKRIAITGGSPMALLNGVGAFLRDCIFQESGFVPGKKRGLTVSDCPVRGVYFANHFHNFYQTAPLPEVCTYLEDMALWGFNFVMTSLPNINLKRRGDDECEEQLGRVCALLKLAQELGMGVSTCLNTSATYMDYPERLKAAPVEDQLGRHGNTGNILCMAKPESVKLIDDDNRYLLKAFENYGIHPDIVWVWPYDEGGCGCEKCAPWGANGYLKASKEAFSTLREFFPDALRLVSTWTFDTPYCGEWEALARSLEEEKWCDILMADAHEDFPRYPLDRGVPGSLPLLSFPEISMWGLSPWGGYGMTGLPGRITRLWRQTEGRLSGEFLYSEGIYEDVGKAVIAGLCQDYNREPDETLAQYARYELGCGDTEKFIRFVSLIEENHTRCAQKGRGIPSLADEALRLAEELDVSLPAWGRKTWRWRILYIRALLDRTRYRGGDLSGDPDTLAAMHELIGIFHCLPSYREVDPYHERVRPSCPEY